MALISVVSCEPNDAQEHPSAVGTYSMSGYILNIYSDGTLYLSYNGEYTDLEGTWTQSENTICYSVWDIDGFEWNNPFYDTVYDSGIDFLGDYFKRIDSSDKDRCNHVAGASKSENLVSVSCTTDESYELVTYCSKCEEEISRSKIITKYAYGHTESDMIQVYSHINDQYEYITICRNCSAELSREPFVYNIGLAFCLDDSGQSYHVYQYTGIDEHVSIPSYYNGKPVTCICEETFKNCYNLKSVVIPDSVTSVSNTAFSGCKIETATIPAIAARAVANYALKHVSIIAGETIVADSLGSCDNLASVTISESVKSIGSGAFSNCDSLTSVVIPGSVTSIGDRAFLGCDNLNNITIPDSVTEIGGNSFSNCPIETATIPTSVINIIPKLHLKTLTINGGENIGSDYNGFRDCKTLTDVTIGDSVKIIEIQAFYSCPNLTSVILGNNVTQIGSSAFESCPKLSSIIVKEGNITYKSVDGNLYTKDGKTLLQYSVGKSNTSFAIPNGVTVIGSAAFCECSSLKSIIIPSSVTKIGFFAFYRCVNLTSVIIPRSVKSIDASFWGCSRLTSVIFENPNGWWYGLSSSATSGTNLSADSLGDSGTAAILLTSTYSNYYWKCGN